MPRLYWTVSLTKTYFPHILFPQAVVSQLLKRSYQMPLPNTIPRFLTMDYDPDTTTFRLVFDERFLTEAETSPNGNISVHKAQFPTLIWSPRTNGDLGIDGCLVFESPLAYRYTLPCLFKNPRSCPKCGGTGYDDDCICFDCRGTGTKRDDDVEARKSFHDFGHTLHIISDLLRRLVFPFYKPNSVPLIPKHVSDMQTMLFFVDNDGGRDSDIRGWLHDDIITVAQTFTEEETASVCEAMRSVNDRLYAKQSAVYEFPFYHGNHFELQVPRSHSALILDKKIASWQCGQDLYCHNVDGRPSQMMLMAGLATIDRLARKRLADTNVRRQFALDL